jgi:sulfur-oxidizing protein SoxX
MKSIWNKLAFIFLALLIAGCGSPTNVSNLSASNGIAAPTKTPITIVTQVTTSIPPARTEALVTKTVAPTQGSMDSMPGMSVVQPTIDAPSVNNVVSGPGKPTATDYVVIWLLYGTPTPKQSTTLSAAVSVPTTDTSAVPPTVAAPSTATTAPVVPVTGSVSTGAASAENGLAIFNGVGLCSSCHDVASGITLVGPSLKGIATRAEIRKSGVTAAKYLHESILAPNSYIVDGFYPGIMRQDLAQALTPQQIDDVIAYLLTLK